MKKLFQLLLVGLAILSFSACSAYNMNQAQPKNIDKNNVAITAGEATDQIDATLIEGNLEDNDFKN
jgi:ABC-type proline/glycine betaine transport system substrate-binding protein